MQTALTTNNDALAVAGELDGLLHFGEQIIKSGMVPDTVKTPQAAVAIILTGRELGIGPMTAFQSINVVQGKPTVSPQLMIALAERTGQLTDYTIDDDGDTCRVTVQRANRKPFTASYGMVDARSAKLDTRDNWKKQPKVMRQWRAISAAFRVVFADVLAGIDTPEEIGPDSYKLDADIDNPEPLAPKIDIERVEPEPRPASGDNKIDIEFDGELGYTPGDVAAANADNMRSAEQLETIQNLCQDLVDHYGEQKTGAMVKGTMSMIGGPDTNYQRIDDNSMTYDDAEKLIKRLRMMGEKAVDERDYGDE